MQLMHKLWISGYQGHVRHLTYMLLSVHLGFNTVGMDVFVHGTVQIGFLNPFGIPAFVKWLTYMLLGLRVSCVALLSHTCGISLIFAACLLGCNWRSCQLWHAINAQIMDFRLPAHVRYLTHMLRRVHLGFNTLGIAVIVHGTVQIGSLSPFGILAFVRWLAYMLLGLRV